MNSAGDIYSGSLPDDEDLIDPSLADVDLGDDDDDDDYTLTSGFGSGEEDISDEDDTNSTVTELPIDNRIPDGGPRNDKKETNDDEELLSKNEVAPERSQPLPEDSNDIPMAITGHEGFFQRTEVLIALIAGGVVGLLFAVFLILLLYFRMKKKDEGSYDLGKKPIYKKAPTNEFYA